MEILSQRDIRWKNKTINGTTSTIGDYGCTLTCLAMLADTTPDIVEGKLEFSVDRIIWTSINKTDLPIRFPDMGRVYSYDNDKVKEAIEKNGGCLVEVDFDGITSTPNDRHWVLFVGKGKAYDPWTGTEILTTKYPILKGFCIINVNKDETMLNDEQKRILDFIGTRTEGDVREAFGALADKPNKDEQIRILQNSIKTLEAQLEAVNAKVAELEAKFVENQKNLDSCQSKLTTANSKIDKLNETISNITEEKNTWQTRYNNKNTEFNDVTEKFDNLSKLFEEYKKHYPQTTKPSIIEFIKSLFLKWKK